MAISKIVTNSVDSGVTLTSPVINTITSAAATALTLQSAGTTAITVNTSQNVGIGTSSPLNKFTVLADGSVNTSGDTIDVGSSIIGSNRNFSTSGNPALFNINSNSTLGADVGGTLGFGGRYTSTSQAMFAIIKGAKENATDGNYSTYLAFGTRASGSNIAERMRIDSSGNLLVGATTNVNTSSHGITTYHASSGTNTNTMVVGDTAGTAYHIAFYRGTSAGTETGSIRSSGSTTSYVTTSDYRLKENIAPMTGALAKVALLKPCTYTWKSDGIKGQGFIAHELQDVAPDAASGEKDAVDDEGKPKYQGIDTSFLVATLTAAIQEQQALIIQLQADVAALKGIK